ncbi:TauD/TfdA family dioxygenase [Streptomyces sp. ME19-01-6]|uniref:TauD/TfdA family dioxygenase n=1 Tax=Streptomyces sp. ME19-01-6 TaxID=3028686 RepID=UPI0029B5F7DF|nr:TauD/TfdA family dioxygenase [Streptomyces sp. ME19-01-6]MDX3228677.1 TauD/TfdA family dioxygenase [Streptomyces sp. ME19-01-6]
MDSITDMRHIVADARCGRGPSSAYLEKLERHGFVVLEPDDEGSVSLEDLMAPLGVPVSYGFGTQLIQEQRPNTENSQFRTGAIPMHVDGHLNANPVSYIGLECLEAPYEGGETLVANSRAFFAMAPDDLVETLREIKVEYWSKVSGFYAERPDGNPVVAPVQVDPVTGEDALCVGVDYPEDPSRNFGAAVVGYSKEQNLALFEKLADVLSRPEVMYTHKWRVGQVLIMDNRRVVHGRAEYPVDSPRKVLRISVA